MCNTAFHSTASLDILSVHATGIRQTDRQTLYWRHNQRCEDCNDKLLTHSVPHSAFHSRLNFTPDLKLICSYPSSIVPDFLGTGVCFLLVILFYLFLFLATCARQSWPPVSFSAHVKTFISYRIELHYASDRQTGRHIPEDATINVRILMTNQWRRHACVTGLSLKSLHPYSLQWARERERLTHSCWWRRCRVDAVVLGDWWRGELVQWDSWQQCSESAGRHRRASADVEDHPYHRPTATTEHTDHKLHKNSSSLRPNDNAL